MQGKKATFGILGHGTFAP